MNEGKNVDGQATAYNNATDALRLFLNNNHFLSFTREVLETSAKKSVSNPIS
jgi:hypothetical protein